MRLAGYSLVHFPFSKGVLLARADWMHQSLMYKCVLHVSISCPQEDKDEEEEVQYHEEQEVQAHEEENEEEVAGIDAEADDTTEAPVVR